MKKEITSREDIHLLVTTFYSRIRKDVYLAPIFERHIQDWNEHIEHLTDFWEAQLFFKKKFTGNPLLKHQQVDAKEAYTINEQHFGIWINHWIQTIDDLFTGEKATTLTNRARKIGTFLHVGMFNVRPKQ
ncbi:group III truncated hemoglobin [uncultured Dokdonia sp.]|uniref:group III truncated hemoglobin n=1 Tax=uncultured Dokdonia sp. TaxID=575653 RepID=UPI00260DAF0C|nr:group III truncated hemoglobin [uncultured Dokdonia sp.]